MRLNLQRKPRFLGRFCAASSPIETHSISFRVRTSGVGWLLVDKIDVKASAPIWGAPWMRDSLETQKPAR